MPLDATAIRASLTVNDLQESLRFYTEGLGFEIESSRERDGIVHFYMLKSGNFTLGIGKDDFAKGRDRKKGVGMRLWIVTNQDVLKLAERVKAAGIKLDGEPEKLPWGPMSFSLLDPNGFAISVRDEGR